MEKLTEQANILVESLPYIKDFSGKVFVIKYGGSAMSSGILKEKTIEDISLMKLAGMKPVVVHGGGPAINEMLAKTGKKSEFIDGLRVTDAETLTTTEMVLSGQVNKEIVMLFQQHNMQAVGISGKDGMTITAGKLSAKKNDLGFVGEIISVNPHLINILVDNDFIPVIAPVSCDTEGQTYNINADSAASAIAIALKAEKLIFLTDTPGILADREDESTLLTSLSLNQITGYIANNTISGGMIPKAECAAKAIMSGVNSVHILDGRVEHSILLEVFTQKGTGTLIKKD